MATLIIVALAFIAKVSSDYSRLLIGASFASSLALIMPARWIAHRVAQAMLRGGVIDEVVIYDGVPPPGEGRRLVDARSLGLAAKIDCPANLDRISRVLGHPDRVVVACAPAARAGWTAALKGLGTDVEILLPEIERLGVLGTRRWGGTIAALVTRGPFDFRERLQKRVFDLAVVCWLLPILLPLSLFVALLITLDDGGPVFFKQRRVGRGNRQFDIFKFRSMRSAESDEAGTTSTKRDDTRITRVGSFLRKTSLDELPQLINVIRGEMSIVGPRPHALGSTAGDQLFWAVDERYWLRHATKPGLTGLAQVRGFRGATNNADDLINRVQADLEYMSDWSVWRDLRILAATARVLVHSNAY